MSLFDKRREPTSTPSTESRGDESAERETILGAPPPVPRPRLPEAVSASREIATIGKTITIRGDLTGEESLVIDGQVDGTVVLKSNDLTVGQSGRVTANVRANVVRIEGQVTGDIVGTEKVVITKTGRVLGNVVAPRVTLEDGAKFKGRIDMDPGAAQQTGAPKPLKSVPVGQPTAPDRSREGTGTA